ncbi:MAG: SGNH/GDSL hydrolase family protein [Crocinitomicaceae bacterium]
MKYLLFPITLFLIWSCTIKSHCSSITKSNKQQLTYLALGDSYTIGESVNENERWPLQLAAALNNEGVNLDTKIIAKTGWRTDNLLQTAKKKLRDEKFDLVSLLIGVNNEYQGESANGFEAKFRACLDYAVTRSKKGKAGVFIVTIPDYGYTPFGKRNRKKISKRLEAYNSICKSVAKTEGVLCVDITPISQNGLIDTDLVADDGLHPSSKQYKLWVEEILKNKVMLTSSFSNY